MFPLNRVVVLLTPLFTAAAAVGSAWLVKHFPGLPVPSQGELLGVELAGATAAGGAALKWLHGHQKYEDRLAVLERDAIHIATTVTDAAEAGGQPAALTATPVDPEVGQKAKTEIARLEGLLADARAALGGQAAPAQAAAPMQAAPVAPAAPASS